MTKLEGAGVNVAHSLAKCVVEVRISGVNKGLAADGMFSEAISVRGGNITSSWHLNPITLCLLPPKMPIALAQAPA